MDSAMYLAAGVVPYLGPVLVALSLDGELRGLILPPARPSRPRHRQYRRLHGAAEGADAMVFWRIDGT